MAKSHHDLSITSYALLAIFVLGQEMFGLRIALTLGLGLAAGWIVLSLLAALVNQFRRTNIAEPSPHK